MFKIEELNLTQRIAYNALFSTTARVLEIVIALLIIKINTNYLGLDGFGEYSTILAFVYIFSVLADFGLYSIVVREISSSGADEERIVNNSFTIRFVLGALVMGSAYFFSFLFPYSNEVRFGILLASFGFWILNDIQVLMGLFQKHLAMDKVSLAELFGRVVQLLGIILCVKYNWGLYGILIVLFLSALANLIFIFFYSKNFIRLRLAFDFKLWKELISKSFPLAVSAILVLIYFKLDTVMLSLMKESRDVGIYSLSYKIMENLIFFPSMVVGLTMPLLSCFAFENRKKFQDTIQRTLNFFLITIAPLVIGIFVVSDKIIYILSKPEFFDSIIVLKILAVALGFIFLGALFSNVIISLKKQKYLAYIYFVGAIFNVVTNFIFIPKFSYLGASATTLVTEFLVTVLMLVVIYKEINYLPSFKYFYKGVFAAFIMAIVLEKLHFLNLFVLFLLGFLVYGLIIYSIGGISKEELDKLLKRKV